MCDVAECERTDWLFGTTGKCSNVSDACECPPRYTGYDAFVDFNHCFLSVDLYRIAFGMVAVTSFVSLAVLLVLSASVAIEVRVLKRFPQPSNMVGTRSTTASSKPSGVANKTGSSTSTRKSGLQPNSVYTSQRVLALITLSLYCAGLFGVLPLEMSIFFEFGEDNFKLSPIVWVCYGLGWAAFWLANCLTLWMKWKTLPDVAAIGKLLKMKSIFVRYPRRKFRCNIKS